METITGIKNLKDQFRKAKLMCGDLRGLKNRFALSEKFNIAALHTYFYSARKIDERIELTADCYGLDGQGNVYAYTMQGLVEDMKDMSGSFEVHLIALEWNKKRTDANRKEVLQFNYSNK